MKRTVDFEAFLTSPRAVEICLERLSLKFEFHEFSLIVEPSAGEGAFYDSLPAMNRLGIDIRPLRPEFVHSDFLDWLPEGPSEGILTIGNPPFGQRGAVAVKFINHAAKFSDVIAMILPMSFNKYTFQNRVDPFFHLLDSVDLVEEFFLDGKAVVVNTVFQIWERKEFARINPKPATSHPDFLLAHAHLSRITPDKREELVAFATLAIPQVGGKFLPKSPSEVSKGSYWFVHCNSPEIARRFELLNFDFLKNMNTAHMSLSKSDIVRAYVDVLDRENK